MGQTLLAANEKKCYPFTDRATYLAQKKNIDEFGKDKNGQALLYPGAGKQEEDLGKQSLTRIKKEGFR